MTSPSPRARHRRPRPLLPLAAILLAPAFAGASVSAAELPRFDYQGAAGVCQAAMPAYEPLLYSRPLGLANIGASTAYVTCAVQGSDPAGQRGAYKVEVNVSNTHTAPQIVTCTMVVVYRKVGDVADSTVYMPRSLALPPSAGGFIHWVPTDLIGAFGGPEISKSGISCILPPATTLQYVANYYYENIGT